MLGSCGLFQIPGGIVASRLSLKQDSPAEEWTSRDPPRRFGPLGTVSQTELEPFLDEMREVRDLLIPFWLNLFRKLSKMLDQEALRQRISYIAKGLKNLWAAHTAFLPEGS